MQILGGEKWAIIEKERGVDLVIKRAVYMMARKKCTVKHVHFT